MGNVIDLGSPDNILTDKIIKCAIQVHKNLGPGLLESIYEECMCIELEKFGLKCERQKIFPIIYEGKILKNILKIDLLVENKIILELKSVEKINPVFEAQLLTYLKITNLSLGLLMNFNVDLMKNGLKRIVNNHQTSADSLNSAPPR